MKKRKSDIYAYLIICFPIFNLTGGIFSYYDEVIGIFAFVYTCILLLMQKLNRSNTILFFIIACVSFIGIVSNIFSGLINNLFAIMVDLLWLWKTFACFILFSHLCQNRSRRERIIRILTVPAKASIALMLITALISQVIDLGVSGDRTILFLNEYNFFWHNGIQTGWLSFCCIMILAVSKVNNKTFKRYLAATCIPLILTMSSLVYCWMVIVFVLYIILHRNSVFKKRYMALLGGLISLFALADLKSYFFRSTSPRKTLIEYGIKTANMYFPLGSGFATYGSEMASRYYSKLYIQFGWEDSWALGRNGAFLNDNFFAGILGQFGWIGFGCFLMAIYIIFKSVNSVALNKRTRICAIATIITIAVVMLGSASAKSMMGVCTFGVLGVLNGFRCLPNGKDNNG